MIPTISVLNIPLFDGDIARATEIVLVCCGSDGKHNHLISATGAHGLVTASRDPYFRMVLNSFHINLPDGMPAVWVSKLKGAWQIKRCYGPDFFREMIVSSRDMKFRHYFCGGKEGVAEQLRQVCERRFHNHHVVGTYSPPFRELTEEEIMCLANDINSKDVDIVWIGLSTPKQEDFAFRLSKYVRVHFICTVGAAFDFYTGRLKQAPPWVQKLGLEWLFRLMMEPRRLWKRYGVIVPSFIIFNFLDLWRNLIKPKLHLIKEEE
jgi:N-acetylglucosaminyldiphosphoundecaprenol N-acetyl-beta-D-mannosaminyltransferase